MGRYAIYALIIAFLALSAVGCEEQIIQTQVRFSNESATKTVYAVWDGVRSPALAPGEMTDYRDVNPGIHTIQWKNDANNKDLTTIGWPNLVEGQRITFPYRDP